MTGKVRLIIVEDDALVVMGMRLVLQEDGCEICGVAITAEEGIELAELHRPDLALVDVALANGSDGLVAAREISGRLGIPVVVCSAHATAEQARAAGACQFLVKPFDAVTLSDAVKAPFRAGDALITLAA